MAHARRIAESWKLSILIGSLLLFVGCTTPVSGDNDAGNNADTKTQQDTKVTPKDTNTPPKDTNKPPADAQQDSSKEDVGKPPENCGNGKLDPGEKCDTAITPGEEGSCPTSCKASDSCTTKQLAGAHCQVVCEVSLITEIGADDGCCPDGANSNTDKDCSETCGNGVKDPGETCDIRITDGEGKCPVTCEDNNPCTMDIPSGSLCQTKCLNIEITDFKGGDGCCPKNGTPETDSDCKATVTCGNGKKDPDELCDIAISAGNQDACPKLSDCKASDVCKKPKLIGSGCTTSCVEEEITEFKDGDSCCPKDATHDDDKDCPQVLVCGNAKLESAETCDTDISFGQYGSCLKRCEDFSPCTVDSRTESDCQRHCSYAKRPYSPQTLDSDFDGCCLPAGDSEAWDKDFDCAFVASFRGVAADPKFGDSVEAGKTLSKTITISEAFKIKRLTRVWVNLEHPRAADLTITLKVDGGSEVVLKAAGGTGPFLATLFTLDKASVPNGVQVSDLANFNGGDANKTWTLTINDGGTGTGGRLQGWRLDFIQDYQTQLGVGHYPTDVPISVGTGDYPSPTKIESVIQIADEPGVKNFEVYVDINHPWQADLKVSLVLPSGTVLVLKEGSSTGKVDPPFVPTNHEHIFTKSSDDLGPLVYRHDDPDCTATTCTGDQICFTDSCLPRGEHSVKANQLTTLFGELFKSGAYTLRVENLTSLQSGTLVNWWIRFF